MDDCWESYFYSTSKRLMEKCWIKELNVWCHLQLYLLFVLGRQDFSIIQGNVTENLALLIAFLSLMHASICMYIADIEMHMVGRFLNSQSPPLSFIFLSLPFTSHTSLQPFQNLCKISPFHLIYFFFCLKYIKILFSSSFFCFPACLIFHSPPLMLFLSWVLSFFY